jgi:hypothetical protein
MQSNDELNQIISKFAASGWGLIAVPAKAWLAGSGDTDGLTAAIRQADKECGNCGCEYDPLYKRALALLALR